MNQILLSLIKGLLDPRNCQAQIIPWASPVLSFGNLLSLSIATVGINPSNREFVDTNGNALTSTQRRSHTLKSLAIDSWKDINQSHLDLIIQSNAQYFTKNPFDWFKKLDYLISGANVSYYGSCPRACHLDLVPYATHCKWSCLGKGDKEHLLNFSANAFANLLKLSTINTLILNGRAIIDNLQRMAKIRFNTKKMPDWTLLGKSANGVAGYSYTGVIDSVAGVPLNRPITILGFNHNIQGSFGVTLEIQKSIRDWISEEVGTVRIIPDNGKDDSIQRKDNTQYIFDGHRYGKNRLVLAVVQAHVAKNPIISASELMTAFDKALQGSLGVVRRLDELEERYPDYRRRFFVSPDETIHTSSGDCVVCTQWAIFNIKNFITRANHLGFEIKTI